MTHITPTAVRLESLDTPQDAEEGELMNPDAWDWDHPVEGQTSSNVTATFEVSFDRDQVRLLSKAARAANLPVGRYIQQVALKAAQSLEAPRS
ncbi:MAG: hypothetical protein R2853_14680 [Thermomicrobiales bacterium]